MIFVIGRSVSGSNGMLAEWGLQFKVSIDMAIFAIGRAASGSIGKLLHSAFSPQVQLTRSFCYVS